MKKLIIWIVVVIIGMGLIFAGYCYQYYELPDLNSRVDDLYQEWDQKGIIGHVNSMYMFTHYFCYIAGAVMIFAPFYGYSKINKNLEEKRR